MKTMAVAHTTGKKEVLAVKIRFLKNTLAMQRFNTPDRTGWYRPIWEETFFAKDQEVSFPPGECEDHETPVDLAKLTYRVDYDIVEYP
jgi:hypothetical protein